MDGPKTACRRELADAHESESLVLLPRASGAVLKCESDAVLYLCMRRKQAHGSQVRGDAQNIPLECWSAVVRKDTEASRTEQGTDHGAHLDPRPGVVPDRPQPPADPSQLHCDPESTPHHAQDNPKSTPTLPHVGRKSTSTRTQMSSASRPNQPEVDRKSTPRHPEIHPKSAPSQTRGRLPS